MRLLDNVITTTFLYKVRIKCHQISVCAAKEGISYSSDNAKIIDYQDNYKYMGDVPFTIYFDFETATGSAVFSMQKCL